MEGREPSRLVPGCTPSVTGPESFRAPFAAAYPFGGMHRIRFPECLKTARSFCLRDSGAVAPSAVAVSRHPLPRAHPTVSRRRPARSGADRKSVVWGKSVAVRVDIVGRRIYKKKSHL